MQRIIRITSFVLIMTLLISGCAVRKNETKKDTAVKLTSDCQVAVAFNPVLFFDYDKVVAFNDINTAMNADVKNKNLTAFGDTDWCWVNISSDRVWRMRNPLQLDRWHNGESNADSKLKAYSLTENGSTAFMCYSTKLIDLKPYDGEGLEDNGLLLSASGDREEGLCYRVTESGSLYLPAMTFTALDSVGGVKTGFLDSEDGSQRTAVVKITINGKVLWCDEIGNCVGESGDTVTSLQSEERYDLPVNEGDVVTFSLQLNGEKSPSIFDKDEPETDSDSDEFEILEPESGEEPTVVSETEIKFLNGYDSTFRVVYPAGADIQTQKIALSLRRQLEILLQAPVTVVTDDQAATDYEILIGETNRKESGEVYSQIRGYRKNCANDYIVTVRGKKVCLAATSYVALEKAANYFTETYFISDRSAVPTDLKVVSRPTLRNFTIKGIPVSKYVIRTEKYPSILGRRAATDLAEFFIVNGGINIAVLNDQTKTENEILVGLTERSGISADVFKNQSLDYVKGYEQTEYKVFFDGNRLFLEAGSDYAANYATQLLIKSLTTANDIPANYHKSGKYAAKDYTLSDGYAYVWGDEFYTSDMEGNAIVNNLDYWVDTIPNGEDGANYVNYPADSKLVTEILKLDATDPLRKLLSNLNTDKTHVEYYSFGKKYQGGKNAGIYGTQDNMMYQITKFDTEKGFYSSHLETSGKMNFRYGILEVRGKVGVIPGASSTFWMGDASGSEDANEIDIFENFGTKNLIPNLHSWPNHYAQHTDHGATGDFKKVIATPAKGKTFNDEFHYIGIEWDKDFIDFYVDGQITASAEMTDTKWDLFEHKDYILISLDVGSAFYQFESIKPGDTGGIEELLNFGCTQYYDYFRIFQKSTGKQRVWDYVNK